MIFVSSFTMVGSSSCLVKNEQVLDRISEYRRDPYRCVSTAELFPSIFVILIDLWKIPRPWNGCSRTLSWCMLHIYWLSCPLLSEDSISIFLSLFSASNVVAGFHFLFIRYNALQYLKITQSTLVLNKMYLISLSIGELLARLSGRNYYDYFQFVFYAKLHIWY